MKKCLLVIAALCVSTVSHAQVNKQYTCGDLVKDNVNKTSPTGFANINMFLKNQYLSHIDETAASLAKFNYEKNVLNGDKEAFNKFQNEYKKAKEGDLALVDSMGDLNKNLMTECSNFDGSKKIHEIYNIAITFHGLKNARIKSAKR